METKTATWHGRVREKVTSTLNGSSSVNYNDGPLRAFSHIRTAKKVRVDPYNKRVAGPYYLWSRSSWTPPFVNTTLSYDQIYGSQSSKYQMFGPVNGSWYTPVQLKTSLNWNRPSLINSALQGISDKTVDLVTFFRELDQTMQLVGNIAKKTSDSAGLIAKKDFRAAAKLLGIGVPKSASKRKEFASNYLAFQFGVLPLLDDLDGAMRHLVERARKLRIVSRARLSDYEVLTQDYSENYFRYPYQNTASITTRSSYSKFVFEQVVVEYQLLSAHWDEYSRLGFTNSGVAVWNGIPYSFVVDTFLNVGQWLGNMDLGLGLELVTASYTQGNRLKGVTRAYGSYTNLPSSSQIKNARIQQGVYNDGKFEAYLMERTVLTHGDLLYSLQFRSPVSVNNAINNTALVTQRVDFTRK